MNDKILKYGDCTITRFDIVGSFFVYLFYNELFKKAKNISSQSMNRSITDTYKDLLTSYSEFTSTDEFFRQSVKGIHNYVVTNTNQIGMTHKECVDFIVSEFVPSNAFNLLRDVQKNKLFHETLSSVVKQYIAKLISKYLRSIIDNRSPDNVILMQNEFLEIICLEKDKVYSKFIHGKQSETVSVDLYKHKLANLKKEYESKIASLMNVIESQKKTNHALETVNQRSTEIIKQLQAMVKKKPSPAEVDSEDLAVKNIDNDLPIKKKEIITEAVIEEKKNKSPEDEEGSLLFDESDNYY